MKESIVTELQIERRFLSLTRQDGCLSFLKKIIFLYIILTRLPLVLSMRSTDAPAHARRALLPPPTNVILGSALGTIMGSAAMEIAKYTYGPLLRALWRKLRHHRLRSATVILTGLSLLKRYSEIRAQRILMQAPENAGSERLEEAFRRNRKTLDNIGRIRRVAFTLPETNGSPTLQSPESENSSSAENLLRRSSRAWRLTANGFDASN